MSDVVVRICPPEMHRAGLERVLANVAPEQRGTVIEVLRGVAETGINVFAGLAVAEVGATVVGAAWLQPQVGRTATLWPPVVDKHIQSAVAIELGELALSAATQFSTVLVQTLLDSPDDPAATKLHALGFVHLADLKYLMRNVPNNAPVPTTNISLIALGADHGPVFERVITETYHSTLDCPGLEGLRDIRDVLDGYRTIGTHDPELWYLVERQGEQIGVLLLAPYPESNQWELVYLGVVPAARGSRIGEQILAEACYRASQSRVRQIVLAVDAANAPALRMYEAAGFREWTSRTAYIKSVEAKCSD